MITVKFLATPTEKPVHCVCSPFDCQNGSTLKMVLQIFTDVLFLLLWCGKQQQGQKHTLFFFAFFSAHTYSGQFDSKGIFTYTDGASIYLLLLCTRVWVDTVLQWQLRRSMHGTIDWNRFLGPLQNTRSSRLFARASVVFLRLRLVLWCLLLDLVQEKISFFLKTDFVGRFRPFLVDVTSGNYGIRFLRPRFYKDSVLLSLCGVAVWSDLIVNFEGIVAGIEL